MFTIPLNPDGLLAILAVVQSAVFEFFPPLKAKFDSLSPQVKPVVMFIVLALIAAVVYGLSCYGAGILLTVPALVCTKQGAFDLGRLVIEAFGAQQGIFFAYKLIVSQKAAS